MTQDRISDVTDLFIAAFNAPPWNDTWTRETAELRLKQQLSSPYDYGLICEIDGDIVGMVIGHEEQYCDEIHFTIREFCTRVDLRGQGIGKKIIRELDYLLKERGVHKVFLATIPSEGTVGVYQKLGFEINDMVMMEKRL
ncbi:MAG: GNAT family N-acetyltransferase [Methanosarcinales archaeon]|nr:GNAT family N-acetyltransferase [Methanosarcinales archaeon]